MGVMLDSSALIGLFEADNRVRQALRASLENHDDGSTPKTHAVVIGELRTGVLAAESDSLAESRRRPVLDTALTLDIETVEADDTTTFAQITLSTKRSLGQNDRWICAAAIRTRSTLVTQDAAMAEQLARYFNTLDLLDAVERYVKICLIPRNPEQPATGLRPPFDIDALTDDVETMLTNVSPTDAEVLRTRFGLDQGAPRTIRQVSEQLDMTPAHAARIERRAIAKLRSLGY